MPGGLLEQNNDFILGNKSEWQIDNRLANILMYVYVSAYCNIYWYAYISV